MERCRLFIFVAEAASGVITGFIAVGLRSHAGGCDRSIPVGFLEGWFVVEKYRRSGVGAQWLAAAENWARTQGSNEMASDTWVDNSVSHKCAVSRGTAFQVGPFGEVTASA